jgi:hypothetical protein
MVFLNFSKDVQNDEKFCPPNYIQLSVLTLGNNVKKNFSVLTHAKSIHYLKKGLLKLTFFQN